MESPKTAKVILSNQMVPDRRPVGSTGFQKVSRPSATLAPVRRLAIIMQAEPRRIAVSASTVLRKEDLAESSSLSAPSNNLPPSGLGVAVTKSGSEPRFSPGKSAEVREWAQEIRANLHRSAEALLKVAVCCARADAALTPEKKGELLKELGFTPATFSKLVKVGNCPRFQVREIQRKLPAAWTTMYCVACLSQSDFNDALDGQIINPLLTRGALTQWLVSRRNAVGAPAAVLQARPQTKQMSVCSAAADTTLVKCVNSGAASISLTERQDVTAQLPQDFDDIPPALDRRPLSAADQCAFDALELTWLAAGEVVRERFKAAHNLRTTAN